jgi:flavin-dependent trigonelline monooxygenase, reductase component
MKTLSSTDADAYKALARHWASTVTVVTAKRKPEFVQDGVLEQDGYTATAFLTVSINPPIILVSATSPGSAHALLSQTDHFAVNLLGESQQDIAGLFAKPSAERGANWAQIAWQPDASGTPIIQGSLGSFSAKVRELIPMGDHTLVLGDVTEIHHGDSADEPLLYHNRAYGKPQKL